MHVRKGDTVVVDYRKDKGKRGHVLRILSAKGRVVVERIAMVKRHTKPTQRNPRARHFGKGRHTGSLECGAVVREVWRWPALPGRHQRGTEEAARVCEVRVGD